MKEIIKALFEAKKQIMLLELNSISEKTILQDQIQVLKKSKKKDKIKIKSLESELYMKSYSFVAPKQNTKQSLYRTSLERSAIYKCGKKSISLTDKVSAKFGLAL